MPKPYSVDLRERAVAAYEAGRLQSDVVQLFKISLATLKRWLAQRRGGQRLAPKTYRPVQRAWGKAPTNRGQNTTVLAAMTREGLLTTMTVEGPANTEAFLTYLDELLCPALRPGQTVLMDNLRVHKAQAVRERIEVRGCRLVFLPRYSPDFNPIEGAFSKLKTFLPRVQARTREALEAAI